LHIGAEDQSFDKRPSLLSPWQSALGTLALSRLDECNAQRTRLGQTLEQELADLPGIHLQSKVPPRQSAYVRLALRLELGDMTQSGRVGLGSCPQSAERDAIERALQSQGLDARAFYTRPIPEYDWWQRTADQPPYPQAQRLIASNLTLPLHYAMTDADAVRMASVLSDLLRRAGRTP